MKCPLCASNVPYAETRCDMGHIIQFLLPEMVLSVLVCNDDGDELYCFHFDASHNLQAVLDWRWFPIERYSNPTPVDLEGTGTLIYEEA